MKLVLTGVPASQGLAVGQVVKVEEGAPVRGVDRGTPVVLVAAMASPRLRQLALGAGGDLSVSAIVVERGGSLSTMATFARELGVPAVFGALDALECCGEGELFMVDGGTGWVYRLDEAGERIGEASLPETLARIKTLGMRFVA